MFFLLPYIIFNYTSLDHPDYSVYDCSIPHTRSILTRILTGPLSVAFYDTQGDVEDLF